MIIIVVLIGISDYSIIEMGSLSAGAPGVEQRLERVDQKLDALTRILADQKIPAGSEETGENAQSDAKVDEALKKELDEVKAQLRREGAKTQEAVQRATNLEGRLAGIEGADDHKVRRTGADAVGKILWMISSTDRGQRIRGSQYQGDKFDIILRQMDEARLLCEFGHTVQVSFHTAWDLEALSEEINARLHCDRLNEPIPVWYEQWPPSVAGNLSAKHRRVVRENLEEFDIFAHMEDDIHITVENVQAYLKQDQLLTEAGFSGRFVNGFARYEVNRTHNGVHDKLLFEANAEMQTVKVAQFGDLGKYIVYAGGNVHSACWIGTRRFVKFMEETCKVDSFLTPKADSAWVEYWSGGFQPYFFCRVWKVIPLDNFEDFLVHHVANNKMLLPQTNLMPVYKFLEELYHKPVEMDPMNRLQNHV